VAEQLHLAIDIGAESGRAILGAFDGEHLSTREIHRFPNIPARLPEGLRWDVLRLWNEILESLRLASRDGNGQLRSVGIDTWGVDFALLDSQGALLGNPAHYRDARTDGMLEQAFARIPREQIFAQTGIQFMQINTLYQLLALRTQRAPQLDAATTLLTIPDLFNYWLTGQQVCEFSNATTTQCYNPRQHTWAKDLLAALDIPTHIFPPIVSPGTTLGPLLPAVAELLGGTSGNLSVVAPACHDTGSAVVAVPAVTEGFAWISSGTWSVVGVETPEPHITPQTLAFNLTNEGAVGGTFRCSKNVMGLWLVQECRRTWAAAGQNHGYDALMALAEQAPPLAAIVDPDAALFLKPGDMPTRIRDFCVRSGQPAPTSHGAVIRCALESVALKYRLVLEQLEQVVGRPLDPIHIVGGGAQNRLLNQLTADATGRTVVAGPYEATALGNLLLQVLAKRGLGSLGEARALVARLARPEVVQPMPQADWDTAYTRLVALLGETHA
jgi:rhamnulokinase